MSPVACIERSALGGLDRLGEGGEGSVFSLSSHPADVFKEFRPEIAFELHPGGLAQTIAILDQLSASDRSFVESRTSWPHTVVTQRGTVVGFLMRALPQELYCMYGTASVINS